MTASPRARAVPALPVDRAFVLQIDADADPAAGRLGGRVEHVVSGRAVRFASLPQLLAFLGRAVDRAAVAHDERAGAPAPEAPPGSRRR